MKETESQDKRQVVDQDYRFYGIWGSERDGLCRVRIVEKIGGGKVMIVTELPENESTSVTNLMEHLAPEIIRDLMPQAFEDLELPTIVEHYPADKRNPETFDLVTFAKPFPHKVWIGGRERISFGEPHWRHLPKEELQSLIGDAL